MPQTTYSFNQNAGTAGGIVDLSPYAVDSFTNSENTGVMKYGVGVVRGSGDNTLAYPSSTASDNKFLGITVNGRTKELDLEGATYIRKNATIGVMRYGRIYARVATGVTVAPHDKLYLVISGDDKGCFTNTEGETAMLVNGCFSSAKDSNGIAQVDLYNAPVPEVEADDNN